MTFSMVAGLIGGIGLFLLGMRLMTDGLKYAAGGSLKRILAQSTSTPLHGLFTGAFITALLQSSSAITVAVLGFVNAGMMDLLQAVTLVYGSNIGTTMTGWLVATLGIKVQIKLFALPAVGVGMVMRSFYSGTRRGGLGEAMAGFGLFFFGIGELTATFSSLSSSIPLSTFAGEGLLHALFYVLIGLLLTFFMQSSSASMTVALTAAIGGVIPLNTAAAMVIGANVGTTTTAILATLDATPNAKRTAAAHVAFNLVTGMVALLLLPFMLNNILAIQHFLGLADDPGTILALFHTTFNLLGVLLFFPFTRRFAAFLSNLFRSSEEDEARPKYLDKTVLSTPVLAIQALEMELGRIGHVALRMSKGAMSSEGIPGTRLQSDQLIIDHLVDAAAVFSNRIQRTNLPAELDDLLPTAMRISGYYSIVAELAQDVARHESFKELQGAEELLQEISLFKSKVVRLLKVADPQGPEFSWPTSAALLQELEGDYQQLKSMLLRAGTAGRVSSRQMVSLLEKNSKIRQLYQHAEKAARYLNTLHGYTRTPDEKRPATQV